MPKYQFFILSILFCYHPMVAQDDVRIIQTLDSLRYSAKMPAGILGTKSVAIVKLSSQNSNSPVRGDWKALAHQTQPGFKKAGIDVVVYYYIEDIFSGAEPFAAFLADVKKRALKNIVFVIQDKGINRIILTKIPNEDRLLVSGQDAWQTRDTNLAVALDNLYKAAANSSQERENKLILEVPEFGSISSPIKGRRGEYYDLNFSTQKLAIPVFADTAKINAVMKDYPYKYGFTPPGLEEKKIRSSGHEFVLYYVHSTGKTVKEMLEYSTTNSETVYVSEAVKDGEAQIKSYNVNTPVYKFYIKHIYTGNVFLGKKWDAAPTWEEALNNYIDNLRTELIRE